MAPDMREAQSQQFLHGAPERSLVQRLDALHEANRVRGLRSDLKKEMKAGRKTIQSILLNPPQYVMTMKLFDLLIAVPKYGRVKVNKVLKETRISPSKTVGGLSSRQRAEINTLLRQ